MKTKEELKKMMRGLGIKSRFKPYQEPGTGNIYIQTSKPAKIKDGRLVGCEIVLEGPATFRVWTPRTRLAKTCAIRYELRVRLLDGEADLYIPASLADILLRQFGASVKRSISEAERNRLRNYSFQNKQAGNALEGPSGNLSCPDGA